MGMKCRVINIYICIYLAKDVIQGCLLQGSFYLGDSMAYFHQSFKDLLMVFLRYLVLMMTCSGSTSQQR